MRKGVIALIVSGSLIGFVVLVICIFFLSYPYKFKDEVRNYSKEFNLEEELVFSVINAESSFKTEAQSGAGALGLMQILPSTAQEVAIKLQIKNFEPSDLYNPAINIRIGCYYLRYLLDMFEGDETLALCSYNAGFNVVKNWLDENGELKEIKYPETRQYVSKIQRGKWVYKHIY